MGNLDFTGQNGAIVQDYFSNISLLRNGNPSSVDALMDLWHPDGLFEFAGSSPVVGKYAGEMAIRTLYKNRLNSNGMPLTLELNGQSPITANLGLVETDLSHIRYKDDQVIVGWKTTIGTTSGQGFDVAGSHLFTFERDKITRLRVNVSPKADQSTKSNLSSSDLTVQDVGRLSLAAWPVV